VILTGREEGLFRLDWEEQDDRERRQLAEDHVGGDVNQGEVNYKLVPTGMSGFRDPAALVTGAKGQSVTLKTN